MNKDQIKRRFSKLNIWSRGDQRAPHKPLLVLYALGMLTRGDQRLIHFSQVDRDLGKLLVDFGPPRKSVHPEYPFWRLQNDGVWELEEADRLEAREGHTDAKKSELLKFDTPGGFKKPIYDAFRKDPGLVRDVALDLLDSHFSEVLHSDILDAVGLDLGIQYIPSRKRDPGFRSDVLTAYEYRCAVCGFDVRLENHTVGVEAAHIKWHQAGGPDSVDNGIALCTLHHKTFDLGVYTIHPERKILVSERVNGTVGFEEWLMRFHGSLLRIPINPHYVSNSDYIAWHYREVFKGPERAIR